MTAKLPDWYPLADATDDEIDGWFAADAPPYDEMRRALPWLEHEDQLDAWIEGIKEAKAAYLDREWRFTLLPGISKLPSPPRRSQAAQP